MEINDERHLEFRVLSSESILISALNPRNSLQKFSKLRTFGTFHINYNFANFVTASLYFGSTTIIITFKSVTYFEYETEFSKVYIPI